jgi:hypothetical protein
VLNRGFRDRSGNVSMVDVHDMDYRTGDHAEVAIGFSPPLFLKQYALPGRDESDLNVLMR